jgi:glycosyltransferase involved in cell wall biosynthesis
MDTKMSKPIKILHILGSADRGGSEANTYDLLTHMAKGFLNELCCLSERGPVGEDLERDGFRVYYLPLRGPGSIPVVTLKLYRLLQSNRYDIIHLYGLKGNFLGRILGKLSRHEIILGALHSMYPSGTKKDWTLWLDRLTLGLSTGYVSNSQAAIDFLVAHGYDRRKFWLIHNGIDIKPFYWRSEREKETIKRKYNVPLDKPIITCVANLRPAKGHEYLIRALHELKTNGLDFLTLLVGDGQLRGELEELVRELELMEIVWFLGSKDREEIPRILAITDIFVLPSLWEGLPTALIEAMAAGCPVVATAVAGTPEIVNEGRTGFLVSPRDPKALAERMKLLLQDQALCKNMGQAGAKRAKEDFSIERMVREYEALYRQLISG